MDNPPNVPHRLLNALIDGELTPAEAEQVTRSLEHNPLLRARLAELRRVRQLTRQALEDDHVPLAAPRRMTTRIAVAASIAICIGFIAGWWAGTATDTRTQSPLVAGALAVPGAEETRVILHLATENSARMKQALDKAEDMLASYANSGRRLKLEVVANGGGLNLLRADTSPERDRIQALQQRYPNLAFLACRKTLEQLKLQKGIDSPLLPRVVIVPSALDQIVERLQSGWTYVQV